MRPKGQISTGGGGGGKGELWLSKTELQAILQLGN